VSYWITHVFRSIVSSAPLRFDGVRFVPWNNFPDGSIATWAINRVLAARDASLWIREYKLEFRAVIEGQPRELDNTVREEAYGIGREALLNACRHAHARLIEAQIIYSDGDFRLRIRDDGRGIESSALDGEGRPGHWGMRGMRERAQKIGGHLEIWRRPNAGSEIELKVPAALAYAQRARRFGWLTAWSAAGE
jgi:signal transduction histidine kinase